MLDNYSIAICGGGPRCTYVLARLSHILKLIPFNLSIKINIFEKSGCFGSGLIYKPDQPSTNYMNRIAGQLSVDADPSNNAGPIRLDKNRQDFLEWSRAKYFETKDERYNLTAEQWPHRGLYGEYLNYFFIKFSEEILSLSAHHCELITHEAEVIDVLPQSDGRFEVKAIKRISDEISDMALISTIADRILLVTGHSVQSPRDSELSLSRSFLNSPYPLEKQLSKEKIPPGSTIVTLGFGLTFADLAFFLTEGRGGRFEKQQDDWLKYVRSGEEPSSIIPISRSGYTLYARAYNEKKEPGHFHKGYYFNVEAIKSLRERNNKYQLSFEDEVFPLMIREMTYIFYRTLFGEEFGETFCNCQDVQEQEYLIDLGFSVVEELVGANSLNSFDVLPFDKQQLLLHYEKLILGESFCSNFELPSNYDHNANRFSWEKLVSPLADKNFTDPEQFTQSFLTVLIEDVKKANQGNISNPWKAAIDGVWRDLRVVLQTVIDNDGLLPASRDTFLQFYYPIIDRLAVGFNLEAAKKIIALIQAKIINVEYGFNPNVLPNKGNLSASIESVMFDHSSTVDVVVSAYIQPFDLRRTESTLYKNLYLRGLISPWLSEEREQIHSYGAVAISGKLCNPIDRSGKSIPEITIWGVPTEGIRFFTYAAARPNISCPEINFAGMWTVNVLAEAIVQQYGGSQTAWENALLLKSSESMVAECKRLMNENNF